MPQHEHIPSTLVTGRPILPEGVKNVSYLGPRYLRERGGDFTDTTLSAKLAATGLNALLLLPEEISGISVENIGEEKRVALNEIEQLGTGREKSRTEVRFGQLHISDNRDASTAELVAAKFIHRLTAPRELHASRAINNRFGDQVTFQPIGFVKRADNRVGYLTRYEHSVTTLDNILWNPSSTEEQRLRAMAFAGMWLASLHNHGIVHGDAQAKNIAYDASQKPRYTDLEGATNLAHGTLDTRTKRLLDIHDLFNPTYMIATTPEEEVIFTDSYLDHQDKKPDKLTGEEINRHVIDTVASAQEQST